MRKSKRVLILAEGGTLAHPTRCAKLAQLALRAGVEVIYGTSREYLPYVSPIPGISMMEISSPAPAEVLRRLDQGKFFTTESELSRQLDENIALLRDIRPIAAIGDVRMALPMACQLENVPCMALINHHWSPFVTSRYPVPDSAATRLFGVRLAEMASRFVTPGLLTKAIQPLNDLRRSRGFAPYPNMRAAYCDGDHVLYVGLPSLAQPNLPANHRVIGPLIWEPPGSPETVALNLVDSPKPRVFISFGSSGDQSLVSRVFAALADWSGTLIATHPEPDAVQSLRPSRCVVKTFIPIGEALRATDLMIGNGGTATVLASLVVGKPYLAIYTNLDQALSVEQYRRTGAVSGALSLSMTAKRIAAEVRRMFESPDATLAARRCGDQFQTMGGDEWTVRQLSALFDRAARP